MVAGGVLGFWGGVGLMGTIFLLVLVTQRCCSRRASQEKKEVSTTVIQNKVDADLSSGLVMLEAVNLQLQDLHIFKCNVKM